MKNICSKQHTLRATRAAAVSTAPRLTVLSLAVRASLWGLAGGLMAAPMLALSQPAPLPLPAGSASSASPKALVVGQINLTMPKGAIEADGQSSIDVTVDVLDVRGQPVREDVLLTLEANAGRLLVAGDAPQRAAADSEQAERLPTSRQLLLTAASGGKATFKLLAPSRPQQALLRVSAGPVYGQAALTFDPVASDLLAVGLIEGVISLRRVRNEDALTPVRTNDGFDLALKGFEREFNDNVNKARTLAARAAFYVKGTISGQTILTAAYDSDKQTRERLLRDIRADALYPVLGDSSVKTYDAQSTQKFYVRLDNGKNYLLYGDFTTAAAVAPSTGSGQLPVRQSDLGQHSRTLTGLQGRVAGEQGSLTAFGAYDTLKQQVEEVRGTGGSFYNLSSASALENSEKIELIVRDRTNPGRIVSVLPLQRFVDYTFEPFSGRIITKAPIQSADAQGNPQSLRMSYEVDQGGKRYAVTGVGGQIMLSPGLEIGGTYVQDRNPTVPAVGDKQLRELASVNAGLRLGDNARLVLEAAESKNVATSALGSGSLTEHRGGQALRAELALGLGKSGGAAGQVAALPGHVSQKAPDAVQPTSGPVTASVFYAKADKDFYNPGASVSEGRGEAGVKVQAQIAPGSTIRAEALISEDERTLSERKSAYLGVEQRINDAVSVQIGARQSKDNGAGLLNASVSNSVNSLYGSGGIFNPNGSGVASSTTLAGGGQQGNPLDTTTLHLGVNARVSPTVTLGLEGEGDISGGKASRAAATAQWELAEKTRLQARYESQTGLGSYADREQKANSFTLGINNTYLNEALGTGARAVQGEVFSEYRLRDAMGGRESQLANGLRNTVTLSEDWRAVAALEHIKALGNAASPGWAVSTGLEYLGRDLWRGSGRLEWRKTEGSGASTGVLSTVNLARKMSQDWTALASNYYATTDAAATPGKQMQDRVQVGAAYRPNDAEKIDLLGKLEYRIERNSEVANVSSQERRNVMVASVHGNWHPRRDFWFSGRAASKIATESFPTMDASGQVGSTRDRFSASLLGARVIYDLNKHFDLGLAANVMRGGGATQYAYGIEGGYLLRKNLWLSAGYNFAGFSDRDLTGNEYTARGPYIRLRVKFDESLFDKGSGSDTAGKK